ncbi:MAG TPA: SPOR domain-containing protein [Bryobacteraceae bacterium]|nr:SPOR domain-containing protein [Bryobacteraceae bacterium]
MPRNEEGEFELVLGNKQLLSLFFIVVVLLGVFFTMGYIVGRSSSPGPDLASAPEAVSSAPPAEAPRESPAEAAYEPPSQRTVEVREAAAPPTPAPTPPPRERPLFVEPAAGETYLQVMAVARPDAELVAEALRKKGLAAAVAAGPSPAFYRVLVGPLSDTASIASARAEIEGAGFKNPIVRKY